MSETAFERLHSAYIDMAYNASYRPRAPSDCWGNITVPLAQLDLDTEADEYAQEWRDEEDTCLFHVGVTDFTLSRPTVFAVEAARLLCAADKETSLRLLRMAVTELENGLDV